MGLALKLWVLLLLVRGSLKVFRYRATRGWLDRLGTRTRPRLARRSPAPKRIARLLEVASGLVPDGGHCLTRSMVLEGVLRRRGHPARIEFGVAHGDGDALEAHAWVLSGDEPLLGGEGRARFTALSPPGSASPPR
ncbi:MAG: lasso peptide biosynthesis B2 protein [Planctomycetota bacterium]